MATSYRLSAREIRLCRAKGIDPAKYGIFMANVNGLRKLAARSLSDLYPAARTALEAGDHATALALLAEYVQVPDIGRVVNEALLAKAARLVEEGNKWHALGTLLAILEELARGRVKPAPREDVAPRTVGPTGGRPVSTDVAAALARKRSKVARASTGPIPKRRTVRLVARPGARTSSRA